MSSVRDHPSPAVGACPSTPAAEGGVPRWALAAVVGVYLVVTVSYSLLTPAWEANDEAEHVKYAQHLLREVTLPPIELASGHQAHQTPLYYALLASWQTLLRIPAFEPQPVGRADPPTVVPGRPTVELMLSHDYNEEQRRHAIWLRLLRALSVALGAAAVLLTFAAARVVTRRSDVALAAAATVALLPKFNVVSAAVTNDALVVPLGSLALLLTALYVRGPRAGGDRVLAAALGLTLGAGTMAKLTYFPLAAVLVAALFLARTPLARRVRDALLALAGLWAVSAWWFARNWIRYGDPLASEVSHEYLQKVIPGLVAPVSWTDEERFLFFVPEMLVETSWYVGGWNQLVAPFALNLALTMLAAVALFSGFRAFVLGWARDGWPLDRRLGIVLAAAMAAAIAAVLLIASQTTQPQGRLLYFGLSAFATVAALGLAEAIGSSARARAVGLAAWPVILLLYNVFVFVRYVLPLRGL